MIKAAERLARQPASRYDYAPLLRTALYTGLRLGELLGLHWSEAVLDARCEEATSRASLTQSNEGGLL